MYEFKRNNPKREGILTENPLEEDKLPFSIDVKRGERKERNMMIGGQRVFPSMTKGEIVE